MNRLSIQLASIILVTGSGCAHVTAPPPRIVAPAAFGRLKLSRIAELKRTPEASGLCKDLLVDDNFVYAIFSGLPLILLRWDLRVPTAEPERLMTQGQMPDWGVRLAKKEGRVILVCGDPKHARAGPKEIESVALMDGTRQQFEAALDAPFFACDQVIPYWFPPHFSRLDLFVGILKDSSPWVVARAKDVDQNRMALSRRGELAHAAYTVDGWLEVLEFDSSGRSSTLELGEAGCREPRMVQLEDRWVIAYVQGGNSLGIRFEGSNTSWVRSFKTWVSYFAVLSNGPQLLLLVKLYEGGSVLLRRDNGETWAEFTTGEGSIRDPILFAKDGEIFCIGMEMSKALVLFRLETD